MHGGHHHHQHHPLGTHRKTEHPRYRRYKPPPPVAPPRPVAESHRSRLFWLAVLIFVICLACHGAAS